MIICMYIHIHTHTHTHTHTHIYIYMMKRQRNTQEVKEHEKCPPSQTKEEEIGNLPEKEFRKMKVKII